MVIDTQMEVSQDDFENLIVTAMEGGSNYWYLIRGNKWRDQLPKETKDEPTSVRIGRALYNDPTFELKVYDLEEPEELLGTVTQASMIKAFINCKDEAAEMFDESYDAWTADTLFQWAVMGEVTFG